ncbi:MAG: hypothetical protein KGZ75_10425 [Syntrophomonadaceae bacterium]|nr:hypothetical protein [Syntrophomonadaceae bacterium]
MYAAIIKNRLRTAKGILRHYWPACIGLLLVACFISYQLYSVVMSGSIETALSEEYIFYCLLVCVALNGYRVGLKQTPIITMNAATLYYLYFTKHFKRILTGEYFWSLLKNILLAAILSGLFNGFQGHLIFGQYFFLLAGYLFLGVLLSWSRYHSTKGKIRLAATVSYIIASAILLAEGGLISIIITYCFAVFWMYYVTSKLRFNLIKYSKDLAFADKSTSAASQFDLGKMVQIAAESEANKKRSLFLYQLPIKRSNIIFYKCVIETIRAGNRLWIIFLCLIFAGFLIYRTSLFSGIPILGDGVLSGPFSVLAVMMVYLNIKEMLKQQIGTLLKKQRQGLFLPMEKREIVWSYIAFAGLLYAILTILVGLLFGSKAYLIFFFYALFIATFIVDFNIETMRLKFKRPFQIAIDIFSIALGYIFIIPD